MQVLQRGVWHRLASAYVCDVTGPSETGIQGGGGVYWNFLGNVIIRRKQCHVYIIFVFREYNSRPCANMFHTEVYINSNTIELEVLSHLVLKHMQAFSDLMVMYCDLLEKSWFTNYKHALILATLQYPKQMLILRYILHWPSKCLVGVAAVYEQRAGMREGVLPLPPVFQYLILMT